MYVMLNESIKDWWFQRLSRNSLLSSRSQCVGCGRIGRQYLLSTERYNRVLPLPAVSPVCIAVRNWTADNRWQIELAWSKFEANSYRTSAIKLSVHTSAAWCPSRICISFFRSNLHCVYLMMCVIKFIIGLYVQYHLVIVRSDFYLYICFMPFLRHLSTTSRPHVTLN